MGSWGKRFQSPPASKLRLGFPWDREAAGDARRERSAAEVYLWGERPPRVSPVVTGAVPCRSAVTALPKTPRTEPWAGYRDGARPEDPSRPRDVGEERGLLGEAAGSRRR